MLGNGGRPWPPRLKNCAERAEPGIELGAGVFFGTTEAYEERGSARLASTKRTDTEAAGKD